MGNYKGLCHKPPLDRRCFSTKGINTWNLLHSHHKIDHNWKHFQYEMKHFLKSNQPWLWVTSVSLCCIYLLFAVSIASLHKCSTNVCSKVNQNIVLVHDIYWTFHYRGITILYMNYFLQSRLWICWEVWFHIFCHSVIYCRVKLYQIIHVYLKCFATRHKKSPSTLWHFYA